MSFTPNMPRASQSLGQTVVAVNTNFAVLRKAAGSDAAAIGDHCDVNNASLIGKHKWVHLPVGTIPTTTALEGALYTKDTGGGTTNLFYRFQSNGAEYQLTGTSTSASNGSLTLPGGIMFKWGTASVNSGNAVSFTAPNFGASFTPIVVISASTGVTSASAAPSFISVSQFIVQLSSGPATIYWHAIGPAP